MRKHARWFRFALVCVLTALPLAAAAQSAPPRDGQHDFDFEIGTWQTHVRIRTSPLTNSDEWIEMTGTTVVRKVWDGRSNLAELNVRNATQSIQGLSLRLYHPQSGQWSVYYANSKNGLLDNPVIGEFKEGRGEFYSQDNYNGRAILVRFVISPVTRDVWRFEQAYSADGGQTWEVNWVATDTRVQ
jgi:hypothetical protein